MAKETTGFVCGPRLYKYEGWFFEIHAWSGPWPLKKNGDPCKNASSAFYDMFKEFDALSDEQKLSYRVGGGCQQI